MKPERCQNVLRGDDAEPVRRQVVELPLMKPLVIEYRLHALCCRRRGVTTCAELPNDALRIAFGERMCAMLALLSGTCLLSKRTTRTLLKDGFGVDVDLGSISNIKREMSRAIETPVARLQIETAAPSAPPRNSSQHRIMSALSPGASCVRS